MKAVFFIAIILSALTACKSQPSGPVAGKQAEKVEKSAAKPDAQAARPDEKRGESETYIYNPKGRRDPFLSIIERTKRERASEKKKKGGSPAEIYDLAEIRVIAIANDSKKYYAMVQFPDMKYFTITEGMALGLYGGRVIKINSDGVLIREHVKNYKGEVKPKDTILKLRKEEE